MLESSGRECRLDATVALESSGREYCLDATVALESSGRECILDATVALESSGRGCCLNANIAFVACFAFESCLFCWKIRQTKAKYFNCQRCDINLAIENWVTPLGK